MPLFSPDRSTLVATLVVLAAATSAGRAPAQTAPAVHTPSGSLVVDSLARAFAEAHDLPSLVVGVSVGGERAVVGVGEVGGAAPNGQTLYEIGSVSKVLTALALADAVTRDGVELGTPVAELLPGWTVGAHADGPVRLVDLATHTSGLARLPPNYLVGSANEDPYASYTPELLRLSLENARPATAPGAAFAYSNWGAGLLGFALAQRAGTTYGELVSERVLAPLGLDETVLTVAPADTARFAAAHGPSGAPVPHWNWTEPTAGAGAWRSTAADLLTLAEAAVAPAGTPLADALALSLDTHHAGPPAVGLGWFHGVLNGRPAVFHDGMVGGSASFLGVVPEAGVAVVVLTNKQASVDALAVEALGRLVAPE